MGGAKQERNTKHTKYGNKRRTYYRSHILQIIPLRLIWKVSAYKYSRSISTIKYVRYSTKFTKKKTHFLGDQPSILKKLGAKHVF